MDSNHLRRKDTTKGPPLRILSLDGGGVRGYSMLIILQELMYRTYVECEGKAPRRDQIPKPCEYFDLIAGTGTGGLIALMLGRLRLDLETCKDVYVRMTRRVFETDKTFAGIPYRSTLFKASKLEEAIRACVREHTVLESEGNDGTPPPRRDPYLATHRSSLTSPSSVNLGMQRRLSRHSVSSVNSPSPNPSSPVHSRGSVGGLSLNGASLWGNPNAYLYDNREFRTKTAITAVYKGTPKNGPAALLRSYDSRREPPPEFNCTIWEAGRATSATGLAFKPIQIGQHIFIDEGSGKFNPSPQILDEATVNEWPGREVGVFMSVGTGKRPPGTGHKQHEWWEDFFADSLGNFAEARRRLISKIEGCETTHQYMLKEYLAKRNVPKENYTRLNVEVGVGEFGMNEWNRLVEISTNTRMYLAKNDVQKMSHEAAVRLARIQRTHQRLEAHAAAVAANQDQDRRNRPVPPIPTEEPSTQDQPPSPTMQQPSYAPPPPPPPPPPRPHPSEVSDQPVFELPAEMPSNTGSAPPRSQRRVSIQDKFSIISSDDYPEPLNPQRPSVDDNRPAHSPTRTSNETTDALPPPRPPKTPIPYPDSNTGTVPQTANDRRANMNNNNNHNYRHDNGVVQMPVPPRSADRPIVTTNNDANGNVSAMAARKNYELPYPDDGPPPAVNRRRKPTYTPRS